MVVSHEKEIKDMEIVQPAEEGWPESTVKDLEDRCNTVEVKNFAKILRLDIVFNGLKMLPPAELKFHKQMIQNIGLILENCVIRLQLLQLILDFLNLFGK